MQLVSKIVCPDCKFEIKPVDPLVVGDILECSQCGTEVEIVSLDPFNYRELIEEK